MQIDNILIPATQMPSFYAAVSKENRLLKNILLKIHGGLGDQICCEPVLRFLINNYKDCKISVETYTPELFKHLGIDVFEVDKVDRSKYYVLDTMFVFNETNIGWQFISHLTTHCVNYPAICALKQELTNKDKEVKLHDIGYKPSFCMDNKVIVHAGKHWPSKTFPKDWWDNVLSAILNKGLVPVLIGSDYDKNRTTVDVDTNYCIDMRNKLSIMESISLLKQSKVLVTNDSAPLHMAVDSECNIGFVATCKHQDYLYHYRRGQFGYKMKNFSSGGMWEMLNTCPATFEPVNVDQVEEKILRSWLPKPSEIAEWALHCIKNET